MKRFYLILLSTMALSCDDGNIDIPEFDFSNADINECGDLVLYKINENETLIIELDASTATDDFLEKERAEDQEIELSETGTNTIIYRTLDETPTSAYYCQNIPPTFPTTLNEWLGNGTLIVSTEVDDDDEDGVSDIDESSGNDPHGDADGDGIVNWLDITDDGGSGDGSATDYTDSDGNGIPDVFDTDGDGIPNYIDSDDDNDGVLTKNEDVDNDNDPTNDDTDGDGIQNYLDDDDDNDGVPTINELTIDSDNDDELDYLDSDTSIVQDERTAITNSYTKTFKNTFKIEQLTLTNADGNEKRFDIFDYGTLSKAVTQ